ncbi:MAG: hypothetical protein Q3976_01755 [Corynebacterium sp.]|nr:hypothetical protein [Corynebacterium sp.]
MSAAVAPKNAEMKETCCFSLVVAAIMLMCFKVTLEDELGI